MMLQKECQQSLGRRGIDLKKLQKLRKHKTLVSICRGGSLQIFR